MQIVLICEAVSSTGKTLGYYSSGGDARAAAGSEGYVHQRKLTTDDGGQTGYIVINDEKVTVIHSRHDMLIAKLRSVLSDAELAELGINL